MAWCAQGPSPAYLDEESPGDLSCGSSPGIAWLYIDKRFLRRLLFRHGLNHFEQPRMHGLHILELLEAVVEYCPRVQFFRHAG